MHLHHFICVSLSIWILIRTVAALPVSLLPPRDGEAGVSAGTRPDFVSTMDYCIPRSMPPSIDTSHKPSNKKGKLFTDISACLRHQGYDLVNGQWIKRAAPKGPRLQDLQMEQKGFVKDSKGDWVKMPDSKSSAKQGSEGSTKKENTQPQRFEAKVTGGRPMSGGERVKPVGPRPPRPKS